MKIRKSQKTSHSVKRAQNNSYLPINTLKTKRIQRNNRESQEFNSLISKKIEDFLPIEEYGNQQNFCSRTRTVISNTSFYLLPFTHYWICKLKVFFAHLLLEGKSCF